jgi:hypothetical protein
MSLPGSAPLETLSLTELRELVDTLVAKVTDLGAALPPSWLRSVRVVILNIKWRRILKIIWRDPCPVLGRGRTARLAWAAG